MLNPVRHISISIACKHTIVYEFVSNPVNLPAWASGVSSSIRKEGNSWVSDSPMGTVRIEFVTKNSHGVLDHYVTLPDGQVFYNPMRVFANIDGSEVVFTLFKWPGMSEAEFEADAAMIERDLAKLKELMESRKLQG